jgi:uncharacterized FAD-dependent dehydrogenase
MQKLISIRLLPSEANNNSLIQQFIGGYLGIPSSSISGFRLMKKSIDARGKQTYILLSLLVFIDEPFEVETFAPVIFEPVHHSRKQVIIVGAGPAGLFAALKLIEHGIKPILLERGKDVRSRRRDLATLNKEGLVNPESNYCFGEGGAGTYSDGKLYTRSTKRGDVKRILQLLFQFGGPEAILYEAHPHIGTNKLPQIITTIREVIVNAGGIFLFEKKVIDIIIDKNEIVGVKTSDGDSFKGDATVLATGHSARDIFQLLHNKKILIESKPFALGVRIEHPQQLIDNIQYHHPVRDKDLPPASYSLVEQVNNRGVFSFCMCPGGIIAPAATSDGEIVVNGWSPSKRNNPFANSGMVVSVEAADLFAMGYQGPLAAMEFQSAVEKKAFQMGGGKLVAPAQRIVDFVEKRLSSNLPVCSYLPGVASADMATILPEFIYKALRVALPAFGKKMKGYYSNEALMVATESRTSSPVRIPREKDSLEHPQVKRLYPCAEGAGYAGGIVSAALDGERVAGAILTRLGIQG